MRLIRYRPAAPLASFVECFWWSERNASQPHCEHMLPSGRAQLVFALHDVPIVCRAGSSSAALVAWSQGVVHGPQSTYYLAGPKPAGTVVGVSFKPAGAGVVLGMPVSEITDRHVLVDDVWGARGRILREELQYAGSPAAAFQMLERRLTERLIRPYLIHPAVAHALGADAGWPPRRVTDIQRQSGYSARHFIALFHAAVGLTPKHYYRVQRFAAVLQGLTASPQVTLSNAALQNGYSDQAHMSREFRDFAGITATQYRAARPDNLFHYRNPRQNLLDASPSNGAGQKPSRRPPG